MGIKYGHIVALGMFSFMTECSVSYPAPERPWLTLDRHLSAVREDTLYIARDGKFSGAYGLISAEGTLQKNELSDLESMLDASLWEQYRADSLAESVDNEGRTVVRIILRDQETAGTLLSVRYDMNASGIESTTKRLIDVVTTTLDAHETE